MKMSYVDEAISLFWVDWTWLALASQILSDLGRPPRNTRVAMWRQQEMENHLCMSVALKSQGGCHKSAVT